MVKEQEYSEPEQLRKLFIGGLDYRTTDESLKAYFEQYGEIVDVVVMKDPRSKKSRGFGFVAFAHAYMVDDAQSNRPHTIDGRKVDTKRAVPRDQISKPEAGCTVKKLFIGGLRDDVTEDDLRDVFSQFGEVVAVTLPTEKESKRKRGFAFIEFDDYDAVDKACLKRNVTIKDRKVDIKKAMSKDEMQQRNSSSRMGGSNAPWGSGRGGSAWSGGRGDHWSGSQGGAWNDRGSWGGSQGSFGSGGSGGSGSGAFNQGGYNQGPWQSGGPGSQGSWGNQSQHSWGSNPQSGGNYGGSGGGWGNQSAGGGGSDFGNNYSQSYGGGPIRNQNYGSMNRSTPYSTGGYNSPGGGFGGGVGGPAGGMHGGRRY